MSEFVRTFEANGHAYRYKYNDIGFLEIQKGRALYNLHSHQMRKGPRSVRELELSGMQDYQTKAFAHLINRVLPDGTIERRTKDNRDRCRDDAQTFLEALTGDQWKALMECQADFFDKAEIVDIESLEQLMPLIANAGALASHQTPAANESASSDSNTSSSNDSGSLENG